MANLLRPLLLDLAASVVRPPAHLLASGLLCEQVDEIVHAFATPGACASESGASAGEWAAVWLVSA